MIAKLARIVAAILLSGLGGCGSASPPAVETHADAAPVATPTPPVGQEASDVLSADVQLTRGMPYAEARERLIDTGWQPLRDPACWEKVGGEAAVCDDLPETDACSADGRCMFRFANTELDLVMRIGVEGPYDRWDTPGEEASVTVTSWQTIPVHASAPALPECPSQDFRLFLQVFASSERIREGFTAPLVRVAELYSNEAGDHARDVLMTAEDYRGFNVVYRQDAYHFVAADGEADPAPLPLQVEEASGGKARLVRYRYGMSEGNSYRFEQQDGCWQLVADPEPPSP